jgi:hypothetical protein
MSIEHVLGFPLKFMFLYLLVDLYILYFFAIQKISSLLASLITQKVLLLCLVLLIFLQLRKLASKENISKYYLYKFHCEPKIDTHTILSNTILSHN